MSGILLCLALAIAIAALMWLAGVRGLIFGWALTALLGGVVAFDQLRQVQPGLQSTSARQQVQSLASSRHAFAGRFTRSENWLAMADSIAVRGNTADAAGILISAVKQHPRDYLLWTGLGTMLTEHGDGLNPGAQLAFERAIALAPGYPAPRYFYGIAKMQSGDSAGALAEWRAVLAAAPATASWRPLVEDRIAATKASSALR